MCYSFNKSPVNEMMHLRDRDIFEDAEVIPKLKNNTSRDNNEGNSFSEKLSFDSRTEKLQWLKTLQQVECISPNLRTCLLCSVL